MHVWWERVYEKPLHLPLDFVVNLKLLLQSKVFNKQSKTKTTSHIGLEPNLMTSF